MNYNIDTNFPKDDPLEIYTPENELLTTVATVYELLYITNQIKQQQLKGFYVKFKGLDIAIDDNGRLATMPKEVFYNQNKVSQEAFVGIPIEEYNKVTIEIDKDNILTEMWYRDNFYSMQLSRMSESAFTIKKYPEWEKIINSPETEGTVERGILETLSSAISFTPICNLLSANENNIQE